MGLRSVIKNLLGKLVGRNASWVYALRASWLAPRAGTRGKPEIVTVARLLQPGDVALDIGANGADWTYALSRQVGRAGHIYAFEADPFYADVTRHAIRLLKLENVTFFGFGLSDRAEQAELWVVNEEKERVAGISRIVRSDGAQVKGQTVAVALEQLDVVVAAHPPMRSVRLIKCDVEGFELMVFRGGSQLIGAARPIVCSEIGAAYLHGYDDQALFDFFGALGYRFYAISLDGGVVKPIAGKADLPLAGFGHDILFIPEEHSLQPGSPFQLARP